MMCTLLNISPSKDKPIQMGKKPAPDPRSKRSKTKYKEMFTELATHQEQLVQHNPPAPTPPPKRVMAIDSEEEVELEVLEHDNTDLDRLCETVHKLLAKNKVSAKNAFDVPMIDLQQLPDFTDSLQNQHAWKRLSSTLQNDYKIYGYRVDAIHTITYNILNTMARRQQDTDAVKLQPEKEGPPAQTQVVRMPEGVESEHLEKKLENLNLNALELAVRVDPILERTRRQFDQLSPNSMLLNTLPIDDQLALRLIKQSDQPVKYPQWGEYSGPWKSDDPLMIMTELNMFRTAFEEKILGMIHNEEMEEWFEEKQNHDHHNHFPDMDMEDLLQDNKRPISKQIKFKHKILRTERDVIEDADDWMGDATKRALGMKVTSKNQTFKVEPRQEDPTTYVNFSLTPQEDTRPFIFRKDEDKKEFHEQIEDRFLLAPKLQTYFSLSEHQLTMEDNPYLPETDAAQPETQVDVRRQQISIMQSKRRMRDLMHERSTFHSLYEGYGQSENISPALCFLTVLHLANEYGLTLEQFGDSNFHIR